jgi:hypothetical protein
MKGKTMRPIELIQAAAGSRRLLDTIYGPQAAELRSQVASELYGVPFVKSAKECQYGRLRKALLSYAGVSGTCIANEDAMFERLYATKAAEV